MSRKNKKRKKSPTNLVNKAKVTTDDKLVAQTVRFISSRLAKAARLVVDTQIEIGQHLYERYFDADPKLLSSYNPTKGASLTKVRRRLAERGISLGRTRIQQLIGVAAMYPTLSKMEGVKELSYSHLVELLPLRKDSRSLKRVTKAAIRNKSSVRELKAERKKQTAGQGSNPSGRKSKSTGPEPSSPPDPLTAVEACLEVLSGPPGMARITVRDLRRLKKAVELWLDELDWGASPKPPDDDDWGDDDEVIPASKSNVERGKDHRDCRGNDGKTPDSNGVDDDDVVPVRGRENDAREEDDDWDDGSIGDDWIPSSPRRTRPPRDW